MDRRIFDREPTSRRSRRARGRRTAGPQGRPIEKKKQIQIHNFVFEYNPRGYASKMKVYDADSGQLVDTIDVDEHMGPYKNFTIDNFYFLAEWWLEHGVDFGPGRPPADPGGRRDYTLAPRAKKARGRRTAGPRGRPVTKPQVFELEGFIFEYDPESFYDQIEVYDAGTGRPVDTIDIDPELTMRQGITKPLLLEEIDWWLEESVAYGPGRPPADPTQRKYDVYRRARREGRERPAGRGRGRRAARPARGRQRPVRARDERPVRDRDERPVSRRARRRQAAEYPLERLRNAPRRVDVEDYDVDARRNEIHREFDYDDETSTMLPRGARRRARREGGRRPLVNRRRRSTRSRRRIAEEDDGNDKGYLVWDSEEEEYVDTGGGFTSEEKAQNWIDETDHPERFQVVAPEAEEAEETEETEEDDEKDAKKKNYESKKARRRRARLAQEDDQEVDDIEVEDEQDWDEDDDDEMTTDASARFAESDDEDTDLDSLREGPEEDDVDDVDFEDFVEEEMTEEDYHQTASKVGSQSKNDKSRLIKIMSFVEQRERLGFSDPADREEEIAKFENMSDREFEAYKAATEEVESKTANQRRVKKGSGRLPQMGQGSAKRNDDDSTDDYVALL